MIRAPIVAGQFYEGNKARLEGQIRDCFTGKFGPGLFDNEKNEDSSSLKQKKIIGIISPHAGYFFSGSCAAHGFKEIAESKLPDAFILLGLSHSGLGSSISLADWETPLGIIKNDVELAKSIMKNTKLRQDELAHEEEHSIEVQLPFLQYVNKQRIDKLRIIPITISHDFKQLAAGIAKAIKESKKEVLFIASSDFTHLGYNYGYAPFTTNTKENMYALDNGAIEFIKQLDSKGFNEYIEKTGATICGRFPISAMIELAKLSGCKNVDLLKYYTSADIMGNYNNAVGYASIKFEY